IAIGFADDTLEVLAGVDSGHLIAGQPTGSLSHEALVEGAECLARGLAERVGRRRPVAVFHLDCPSRGQRLGERVLKERIVASLQGPLGRGELVPWLGAYGRGQIVSQDRRATVYRRSSALCVLVDRDG
ncbi:MAG TPA: hypothetical protein VKA06_11350, partial [Spirochaetia bacterium]|nr:hypothetical protein [Spirochaetia bacterium]